MYSYPLLDDGRAVGADDHVIGDSLQSAVPLQPPLGPHESPGVGQEADGPVLRKRQGLRTRETFQNLEITLGPAVVRGDAILRRSSDRHAAAEPASQYV